MVLQRLRSGGNATPVLILSARDAPRDRIVGLNAGRSDYLVKPFELEELLAGIHLIERRRSAQRTPRRGELVLTSAPCPSNMGARTLHSRGASSCCSRS